MSDLESRTNSSLYFCCFVFEELKITFSQFNVLLCVSFKVQAKQSLIAVSCLFGDVVGVTTKKSRPPISHEPVPIFKVYLHVKRTITLLLLFYDSFLPVNLIHSCSSCSKCSCCLQVKFIVFSGIKLIDR